MASPAPLPQWPAHPRRSRIRGWIWKTLAVISWSMILLWPVVFSLAGWIEPGDVDAVRGGFELGLLFFGLIGVKCYMRGKRHLAIAATELLSKDTRPPVIYLRSFQHDKKGAGSAAGSRFWGGWAALFDLKTIEERLAEALTPIGPVIAIGKPGEKLPALGAARLYVGDDDWQETIRTLMARAKLVVLLLGDTPGFWWELERSVKELPPERLVLIVPFRKKRYDAFREQAASHFPHALPEYSVRSGWRLPVVLIGLSLVAAAPFGTDAMAGAAMMAGLVSVGFRRRRGLGKLSGLIYFRPDWTAEWLDLTTIKPAKGLRRHFYGHNRMHRSLTWNMRPVFSQLGVEWTPPRMRRGYIGAVAVLAVLVAVGVIGMVSMSIPLWRESRARGAARAAFADRVRTFPGMSGLDDEAAVREGRALARAGVIGLDDDRLAKYLGLLGQRWIQGARCIPHLMTGDDPHPSDAELGYLPVSEVGEWYRMLGDAAAARIDGRMYDAPPPPAIREAYRQYEERQTSRSFHEVLFVMRGRTQSGELRGLLEAMDPGEPFSAFGFVQVSEEDVCRVFGEMHATAVTLPPPHNAVLARALAAAKR